MAKVENLEFPSPTGEGALLLTLRKMVVRPISSFRPLPGRGRCYKTFEYCFKKQNPFPSPTGEGGVVTYEHSSRSCRVSRFRPLPGKVALLQDVDKTQEVIDDSFPSPTGEGGVVTDNGKYEKPEYRYVSVPYRGRGRCYKDIDKAQEVVNEFPSPTGEEGVVTPVLDIAHNSI